ncbi:MAG: hypothetical protein FRX49_01744 [Trebouxia sp. A1-2]|nr:MAG: hypothetical protein FRX49_01744 [Trebouxia sp. A1-2]
MGVVGRGRFYMLKPAVRCTGGDEPVNIAAGMGIVHQVHRGSSPEGVMLYAGVWGRQHDRNDDVQPDPVKPTGRDKSEQFYYNHWVGNTGEGT